jgi:hypothetical protein
VRTCLWLNIKIGDESEERIIVFPILIYVPLFI